MNEHTDALNAIAEALKDQVGEIEFEIVGPEHYGSRFPELQFLLRYGLEDTGGPESGPRLDMVPFETAVLRYPNELDDTWRLEFFIHDRYENEGEIPEIEYAKMMEADPYGDPEPDFELRLMRTSSTSDHRQIADEIALALKQFKTS